MEDLDPEGNFPAPVAKDPWLLLVEEGWSGKAGHVQGETGRSCSWVLDLDPMNPPIIASWNRLAY